MFAKFLFLAAGTSALVLANPVISRQPSPLANSVSLEATLANRVAATTTNGIISWQWRHDGADLPGQTNGTLTLTNIQLTTAGTYTAIATDADGSTEAKPWVVSVDPTFRKVLTGPVAASANGSAAAWGDYDNDGLVDLYVTTFNGVAFLFHNEGNGAFSSITKVPVVAGGMNSFGCAWADYDNDGYLDLIQGGYNASSRLFRNLGNGTFEQIKSGAIAKFDTGANNIVWGDFDKDGNIDLFCAISYNSPRSVLFRNNGDASFSKITNSVVTIPGNSQGAAWSDYDNDGFLDLLINRTGANSLLFHNEHDGTFKAVTNAITSASNEVRGGPSWGDFNNDGLIDLFVSSYGVRSALFQNLGNGEFLRITNGPIYEAVAKSTGGAWADYDNDGWLDLYVSSDSDQNGLLFHNKGDGTFERITTGSPANDPMAGQGAAWADYDDDGFPDLFVPNIRNYKNYLYRNSGNSNAWLSVKLEGSASNRSAIGAKVRLLANIKGREFWQMREISGGGSLGSQNDLRALFGLGKGSAAKRLRIEWPSGSVQEFSDVPARQHLTIREPAELRALGISQAEFQFATAGANQKLRLETSTNLVNWSVTLLQDPTTRVSTNSIPILGACTFVRARSEGQ
jgi:hypothetical protein